MVDFILRFLWHKKKSMTARVIKTRGTASESVVIISMEYYLPQRSDLEFQVDREDQVAQADWRL